MQVEDADDWADTIYLLEQNCSWWQITRSSSAWVICAKVRPETQLGVSETSYGKVWYRRKGESLAQMARRAIDRSLEGPDIRGSSDAWNPDFPRSGAVTPIPEK